MGFAWRRDFMQRAANEPATERRIDGGNAKGQDAGTTFDPWSSLQSQEVLAKLLDHGQAFEDTKAFGPSRWAMWLSVHDLFYVNEHSQTVKPQGNGLTEKSGTTSSFAPGRQ
jgi:hypothetical protein